MAALSGATSSSAVGGPIAHSTASGHAAPARALLLCSAAHRPTSQSLSQRTAPRSQFLGQPCGPRMRTPGTPPAHRGSRGRAGAPSVQCNLVQKVSAKELETLLGEERKMPIVIDFYATWCGPCILLAKQLEELAVEYHGTVQFVKVDTDEEYDLANQLEIRGLPTLVFVSKEKEKLAKRTEGILPFEALKELIEDL